MFMGEFQHNIDAKGRMIVPAKFRQELGERFIVTRGLDQSHGRVGDSRRETKETSFN